MIEHRDAPVDSAMLDGEIADYRKAHEVVLTDQGHPEHGQRVGELTRLYQRRFAADGAGNEGEPAQRPAQENGFGDAATGDLSRWMTPPETGAGYEFRDGPIPEEVRVGDGLQSAPITVDPAFEGTVRDWLHEAGASLADGAALHATYLEELNQHGFTDSRRDALAGISARHLSETYGDRQEAAMKAARRMVREIDTRFPGEGGRPGIVEFLETTGLGNHPRVIDGMIRAARQRGYFTG
ncbi:MAG: hypothetical protein H6883_08200 [Rhodobiaceae bacterium]|nr:hypothetical protein [Rhodobiaceae bacterium]